MDEALARLKCDTGSCDMMDTRPTMNIQVRTSGSLYTYDQVA